MRRHWPIVCKEANYYLAAILSDLNITRYKTITTTIMEVIKKSEGWTQDHTDLIYVYEEVFPENNRHMGLFQPCCLNNAKLPSPMTLRRRL